MPRMAAPGGLLKGMVGKNMTKINTKKPKRKNLNINTRKGVTKTKIAKERKTKKTKRGPKKGRRGNIAERSQKRKQKVVSGGAGSPWHNQMTHPTRL
jgi:hypothetical protein